MAGWSDYADWTSENTLVLCDQWKICDAIWQSVKECLKMTNSPIPADPLGHLDSPGDFMPFVESNVSGFINPLNPVEGGDDRGMGFINHTYNGGVFAGGTSIPCWTQAAALAAIGASERLLYSPTMRHFNKWAYQQYRLLNLLLWYGRDFTRLHMNPNLTHFEVNSQDKLATVYWYEIPYTWAECESRFLAEEYDDQGTLHMEYWGHKSSGTYTDIGKGAGMVKLKYLNIHPDMRSTLQFWGMFNGSDDTFEDQAGVDAPDVYQLLNESVEAPTPEGTEYFPDPDLLDAHMPEPAEGENRNLTTVRQLAVLKFDGDNGRKFKAP